VTKRRPTLGSDPLDALVPDEAVGRNGTPKRKPASKPTPAKPKPIRATFHLPEELVDAARDAAYWTPGLTLAAIVEAGLRTEVRRLEKQRGGPFPRREKDLVGGRPIGS
jgi:hypothetical protein